MKKKKNTETPNVSGSYQIVGDDRKEEIKEQHNLDDESLYYARIFMED